MVKLVIAVTIAATLVGPFVGAISGNVGTVSATDNITASTDGDYQDLEGYDIDGATFTAEVSGTTLSEGSDYELNETEGTVSFLTGSANVNDGDTVDIAYDYQATDGTTSTIADLLPLFVALLVLVTIAKGVTNRL